MEFEQSSFSEDSKKPINFRISMKSAEILQTNLNVFTFLHRRTARDANISLDVNNPPVLEVFYLAEHHQMLWYFMCSSSIVILVFQWLFVLVNDYCNHSDNDSNTQ